MGLPPKISCQHNVRAKASSLRPSYIAGDKPIPQPQTRHRKSALSTCAPVRLYKEKKTKEGIRGGRISVDTTNHPRQVPLYPSLIRFRGFNPPTPPQFSSSVFLRIRLSRVISFLFVSYFYCRRGWEIDVSILRAYFRRFSGFRVRGWRCPYPRFPAGLRGCIFEGYTTCVTVRLLGHFRNVACGTSLAIHGRDHGMQQCSR